MIRKAGVPYRWKDERRPWYAHWETAAAFGLFALALAVLFAVFTIFPAGPHWR